MNTSLTFPPGSHLDRLGDMIATRKLTADELATIGMGEAPRDVQGSPFVHRGNLQRARFALDAISKEHMADFLADYLAGRFDRVRSSFIGRDIARKAETGT